MKALIIKHKTDKGKKAINEIIFKTEEEYNIGKISSAKRAIYDLFVFEDGIIKINAVDPAKTVIVKMLIKPRFKRMLKKDDCKINLDYTITVEDI